MGGGGDGGGVNFFLLRIQILSKKRCFLRRGVVVVGG